MRKSISASARKEVRLSIQNIQRIGLMADSHGEIETVEECIQKLNSCNVDAIIHLGDFLDSQNSRNTVQILDAIHRHHVLTVKGNNEHQIENALKNGWFDHVPAYHQEIVQSFLSQVPMRLVLQDLCFNHSLPYDSIRSIYEPMDKGNTERAESVFHDTDYHIVFCGHSHSPILFRNMHGKVSREALYHEAPVKLHANERFIIIVGAATEGESGVMDVAQMTYERIRI
jgi:predicted phosphodiesterase